MAYPLSPGPRIAYDLDGSFVFLGRNVGEDRTPLQLPPATVRALNADKSSGVALGTTYWNITGNRETGALSEQSQKAWFAVIFPTPTRLRAWFHCHILVKYGTNFAQNYFSYVRGKMGIYTSQDTTNGMDGTWTFLAEAEGDGAAYYSRPNVNGTAPPGYVPPHRPDGTAADLAWHLTYDALDLVINPAFRVPREVVGAATRNVRGVRFMFTEFPNPRSVWSDSTTNPDANMVDWLGVLHLYGEPDEYADPDRLEFVTADGTEAKRFDWGDVYAGETLTQTFRVRNLSAETANMVELSTAATSPGSSPSASAAVEFSTNGTTFSSSLSISSIAPGDDSALLYARLVTPNLIGPWGPRIVAEVGSWT